MDLSRLMNVQEKWVEICSRVRELDRLGDEAAKEYQSHLGVRLSSFLKLVFAVVFACHDVFASFVPHSLQLVIVCSFGVVL